MEELRFWLEIAKLYLILGLAFATWCGTVAVLIKLWRSRKWIKQYS